MSQLHPSYLAIQGAEAMVAVGLEWTPPECMGEVEGLTVEELGLFIIAGLSTCSDVAQQPENVCLDATFLALTGEP